MGANNLLNNSNNKNSKIYKDIGSVAVTLYTGQGFIEKKDFTIITYR